MFGHNNQRCMEQYSVQGRRHKTLYILASHARMSLRQSTIVVKNAACKVRAFDVTADAARPRSCRVPDPRARNTIQLSASRRLQTTRQPRGVVRYNEGDSENGK